MADHTKHVEPVSVLTGTGWRFGLDVTTSKRGNYCSCYNQNWRVYFTQRRAKINTKGFSPSSCFSWLAPVRVWLIDWLAPLMLFYCWSDWWGLILKAYENRKLNTYLKNTTWNRTGTELGYFHGTNWFSSISNIGKCLVDKNFWYLGSSSHQRQWASKCFAQEQIEVLGPGSVQKHSILAPKLRTVATQSLYNEAFAKQHVNLHTFKFYFIFSWFICLVYLFISSSSR